MREIAGSERIEETNEHRLKLAEKVLQLAATCLEMEISIDVHRKKDARDAKLVKDGLKSLKDGEDKPKGGQYL
jgi:hypothetical protein